MVSVTELELVVISIVIILLVLGIAIIVILGRGHERKRPDTPDEKDDLEYWESIKRDSNPNNDKPERR